MIQIFRLQPSSVLTCSLFMHKCFDKTFICSHCLRKHWIITRGGWQYSTHKAALFDKLMKVKSIRHNGKKKKMVELLKVTENKTTQTTMHIGKLNASHVTAFAEQPGMILTGLRNSKTNESKLECTPCKPFSEMVSMNSTKLKSKTRESSHTSCTRKENLKIGSSSYSQNISSPDLSVNCSNKESYLHSRIKGDGSLVSDISAKGSDYKQFPSQLQRGDVECHISEKNQRADEFDWILHNHSQDVIVIKNTPQKNETTLKKKELIEAQTENEAGMSISKQFSVTSNIKRPEHIYSMAYSYIHVCIKSGLLDYAYAHIIRKKDLKYLANNIDIYNLLIEGFARKGNIAVVSEIMNIMNDNGTPHNCQTYALYLDCLARGPYTKEFKEKKTLEILKTIVRQHYTLNNIFAQSNLTIDQTENISKQIRMILPDFDEGPPSPSSINLNSSNILLRDLYKDSNTWKSPFMEMTSKEMDELIDEQLEIEEKTVFSVEAIGNIEKSTPNPKYEKLWESLNEVWKKELLKVFNHSLGLLEKSSSQRLHLMSIYPFLKCLPPETFISLMEQEIMDLATLSEYYSASSQFQYERLGHKVWLRYIVHSMTGDEKFRNKLQGVLRMYCKWYLDPGGPARNTRQKWQMLMEDVPGLSALKREQSFWPFIVRKKVGKFLYNVIFRSVFVPSNPESDQPSRMFPAFYLVLRYVNGKLQEEIKYHPNLNKVFRKANLNKLFFSVDQVPMVCPPKPWHKWDNGGYLIYPVKCIRETGASSRSLYDVANVSSERLYPIFDSLNQLQSIPWVVNEEVLDVVLDIFKSGAENNLNVPSNPFTDRPLLQPRTTQNWTSRNEFFRRLQLLKTMNNDYGLWCEALYKLSLANHFRKRVFWAPQNLDFRGRVYPLPPHLNHLGSDLYRALLKFAKKERLGPKGLDWLKIHAINLTGTHKNQSVQDRLDYANSILPQILDSTENPLDKDKWWQKSECPWQTLAVCFEIRNALMCDSPENYKSGFPVHQDGSCNGLQHYAALGRDKLGASGVNLEPSNKPQDVYSVVSNLVEASRKKDAEEGVKIAKVLEGFITRKLVKRTVMTTVYGVTFYGAKEQVKAELKNVPTFPEEKLIVASMYVARKIFSSLSAIFISATKIQEWFYQCAKEITKNCRQTVTWVTPLGLPVTQPYTKMVFEGNSWIECPITRKQVNAFAPNFIHSLDSTHMMLTSLYCERAGVTFASIHDCFWTHPINVDTMNVICREKFIELHSQEILKDLSEHFIKKYGGTGDVTIFSAVPPHGHFDLNKIMDSVYFFS